MRIVTEWRAGARIPRRKGHKLGEWVRICIEPVPKGRPRFHLAGRRVVTFTPKKTHDFEKDIARAYTAQCLDYYKKGIPLCIELCFGMPIPKSVSKKRREKMISGEEMHIKKPDVDNLIKAVLDGLNGIAYEDDAQIISISAAKKYTEKPFVSIRINEQTGGQHAE